MRATLMLNRHDMPTPSAELIRAAARLSAAVERLKFTAPVAFVYNPLVYAWRAHEMYLRRFGGSRKRVVFLGMNPGPFGMAQTGVPFGEVAAVRDWLGIVARIGRPPREHPKRLIEGFACRRSEVSGRRLWGFFAERFGHAEKFFAEHFVANYCPLAFLDVGGRNLTPDKLPASQAAALFAVCDQHLRRVVEILEPEKLIGIGDFAARRAAAVFNRDSLDVCKILHPSPASPAANRGWARVAAGQLKAMGLG
jgi:single-strand selective monofunctional uracil DNA glycosylase